MGITWGQMETQNQEELSRNQNCLKLKKAVPWGSQFSIAWGMKEESRSLFKDVIEGFLHYMHVWSKWFINASPR